MEELLKGLLLGSNGLGAYSLVFIVLVVCGLGVPLPEDISLIFGGFLAYEGAVRLPWMMVVGFVGILVGDSLIYSAGRRMGNRANVSKGFLSKVVTPEKRAKVAELFAVHGQKIVMIARFLPGVRAVTYFTAGSARMSYWRFILFDGLAALASAPLFVYLGYHFGGELEYLIHLLKQGQLAAIGAVAAVLVAYVAFRQYRKRAAKKRAAEAEAAPAQLPAEDAHRAPTPDRSETPATYRRADSL